MPCIKTAGWSIDCLPAWRPFSGVTIVRRRVEPQAGNNCERVTLARVDRNPFAGTALAVAAKLGRAHRRAD